MKSRLYKQNKEMVLTEEDELNFKQSKKCFYCNEPFNKHYQNLKKCRDHCHITGKYRCAAHSLCNVEKSTICLLKFQYFVIT